MSGRLRHASVEFGVEESVREAGGGAVEVRVLCRYNVAAPHAEGDRVDGGAQEHVRVHHEHLKRNRVIMFFVLLCH